MSPHVIGTLALILVVPLVLNEVTDVAPWVAARLVRRCASLLGSPEARARYLEEWSADLERVPGKITKLIWACDMLFRAVPRMRRQIRRGSKAAARRLSVEHRHDLLALTPIEFEHLTRRLFEAMGLTAWVTQAGRDDGVDGFASNPDPVLGGLCVIQAKRHSRVVPIEAVRALEGTIQDKRAAKGILVSTSWFSSGDREFADRMGRIELIDGSNLKALLMEYLGIDVMIGLDRLPLGWLPSDIA